MGWCERVECDRAAVHVHHIKGRLGGDANMPEHLAHLCLHCHQWVHMNPKDARAEGMLR